MQIACQCCRRHDVALKGVRGTGRDRGGGGGDGGRKMYTEKRMIK